MEVSGHLGSRDLLEKSEGGRPEWKCCFVDLLETLERPNKRMDQG